MARRIALLTALVLAVTAAPADAQEKLCQRQLAPPPVPTQAEKELADLQSWADQRAEFGFRHDIPYVRELVRRGVWEYDVGYIPVTPRENVYLKLRDKLELGTKANRYLRHHRDVDGGLSVKDDWPHEPYLLQSFTKDVAKHLAALKRLARYPDNLRAKRVRYSERELHRLADRIWDDQKQLERAGFYLSSTGSGNAANRVRVDLFTARTDAAAYFRKRYGAAVEVTVGAREPYSLRCVESGSYTINPDGLGIVLGVSGEGKPERVEVTEFPDRIEVGAVQRVYNGASALVETTVRQPVALTAALGTRAVIDAASGKRLRQVGPSPGDPPCDAPRAEKTRLERAIEQRTEYGMRADPAYVQQRLNSRSAYTKAELRWLTLLRDIDYGDDEIIDGDLSNDVKEYAGSVIVAKYPAPPLVVYRFTSGAAKHLAAIKRRSEHPANVRVATVNFSLRDLEALQERIGQDAVAVQGFFDGYGRAGFSYMGANVDRETGTIVVRLITTRTDHAAYFANRYGAQVRTEVIGDRFECAASYAF